MKLNVLMTITAVVTLLFGLSFLLLPVQTMTLFGVDLDVSGHYIARFLGSAFLGIAVITWFARNSQPNNEALRAILMGSFILTLTGTVVSFFDALYGVGNSLVWSIFILYFLLAVGFGYFHFKK